MKTPDFDDLLAAFDIPDIEAIQSSPDEERNEVETHGGERDKRLPQCSPAPHNDLPTVSVIVKNTVQSESQGEKERHGHRLLNPPKSDSQYTGSQLGPGDASDEPKVTNGLKRADTKHLSLSDTEHLTGSTLTTFEDKSSNGVRSALTQKTKDGVDSVKPPLYPQFSTTGSVTEQHIVSSFFSPLHRSVTPPPSSPHCSQDNTSSPRSPPSCSLKPGINHVSPSDEEDSEPDLGGPLVIQESPESPLAPMPKLKRRINVELDLLGSSEKTACKYSPHISALASKNVEPELEERVQLTTPISPDPLPLSTVRDEKYPEHVIDERDSPESPPPSETGLVVPNSSTNLEGHHRDGKEEPMEREPSEEHRPGSAEELTAEVQEKGIAARSWEDTVSASVETDPSLLSPVKVKIKMPKGNITTTETGVAPKKSSRANIRGVKKTLPECPATRSKGRGVLKRPKAVNSATLNAAATVKGTKLKMSPTSVSITKTTSVPSTRVSPAGIKMRNLDQKTPTSGIPAASSVLPTLSSSRPASIVNSTGAIISKSQTNLVEAFNKILNNKNLLPSYKPDLTSPHLTEWGISLPAQGYRCLECGDSFALEQSLARHYDRRSLRIEVTCNHCAKRLAFFNKCSLLLHAREHKEKGLIMQCSHLVMKPVPVGQMIGQQEPTAVGPSSVLSHVNPNTATFQKSEEVQYCKNKCPECQTQFSSPEKVAEHFQELKSAQSTSCADCSPPMLLSNSCCAAAHKRIHQTCPPHVCPECGGTAKQTIFKTHLDETCLHFARRIGYKCSSCLVVFGGLNSVKSHIQQAHCDVFHKCPSCPMAFKSAPSIQNHIAAQHPTLNESQAMLIYKCVMCDTVFTHKSLLYVHFDTHLTNQKVHVFKCPECTKLFSQRTSLMDHFKTHKINQELLSPPIALSHPQPSVKLESSEGEEWRAQVKEVKKKTLQKQFPCNKCESSFATTSSLRRHIKDKHKPLNRGFRCQFCNDTKKTFSSRAMLDKHIQLRHNLNTGDQDILMEGGDEADSSSEQDGSSGYRRRRRAAVNMEQDEASINGVSPQKKWQSSSAPATDSPPEAGFRCAPCGFTCEDQGVFLEHISQHRKVTGASTQQCLQCGVCFTSNHSLSRHRFIVHKVKDSDNQDAPLCPAPSPGTNHDSKSSQGCSAPASPAVPQEKDCEGALTCKVCGKQFEKATDLNTHFRTHGMAFINARKIN